jgi:hypothetical protein
MEVGVLLEEHKENLPPYINVPNHTPATLEILLSAKALEPSSQPAASGLTSTSGLLPALLQALPSALTTTTPFLQGALSVSPLTDQAIPPRINAATQTPTSHLPSCTD